MQWQLAGKLDHHYLALQLRSATQMLPIKVVSKSSWQVLVCTVGLVCDWKLSLVCDWKYLLGHLNIPSRKKDRILCAALKTFYSWSKNGGSFLDLEYLREIHQKPAQPWVGVLNKWNGMIAVCGKWVLLPKFNLHF